MAFSDEENPDLQCYESFSSATKLSSPRPSFTRYKPRCGSGIMKPVRRAAIITRRKIGRVKLTKKPAAEDGSDIVVVAEPAVGVPDARSETRESALPELTIGEVLQTPESHPMMVGSAARPSSGGKRVRSGL